MGRLVASLVREHEGFAGSCSIDYPRRVWCFIVKSLCLLSPPKFQPDRLLEQRCRFPVAGLRSSGHDPVPASRFVAAEEPVACGGPRYVGVSSFGMTGTLGHVVLESAPSSRKVPGPNPLEHLLLVMSAGGDPALRQLAGEYAALLRDDSCPHLSDLLFTAAAGRWHGRHRAVVMAASREDLLHHLDGLLAGESHGAMPPGFRTRSGHANVDLSFRPPIISTEGDTEPVEGDDATRKHVAARHFLQGRRVAWSEVFSGTRRRVRVPLTPMDRKTYLVEPEDSGRSTARPPRPAAATPLHPLLRGSRRS